MSADADKAAPVLPAALRGAIDRQPVAEQVARRIMELVRAGSLKPGDQLPTERELSVILDVSRPSVRESLRALSILGILNIRHGGGVYISALAASDLLDPLDFFMSLDPANLISLFEARAHVEAMMARIAAATIDAAGLGQLADLIAEQERARDDAEVFRDTDIAFHRTITDCSANPFLTRMSKTLQVLAERGRQVLQELPEVRHASIADHRAILDALRARDADAAARAMERHIGRVRDALIAHWNAG